MTAVGAAVREALGALGTFWQWREAIKPGAGMAWDIETERLDPASPTRCVGYEIDSGAAVAVDETPLSDCRGFHMRVVPGCLLIAHNAKYEAQALMARGIDPRQFVWWDTFLAEWVLVANNTQGLGLNLDDTAQRYGGTPKDPWVDEMIKAGRVMEVPMDRLMDRNRKDVADCRMVYESQLARMTEAQIRLAIVRSMYMLELAAIELEGKQLDPARVFAELERCERELAAEDLALREITGGANPRSVNEMAPVLYGMWPAGTPEADKYHWAAGCGCNEPLVRRKPSKNFPEVAHPAGLRCSKCKVGAVQGAPLVDPLGFKEPVDSKGKPIRAAKTKAWPNGRPSLAAEVLAQVAKKARTPRQKTWAKHYSKLVDLISERDKNLRYFAEVCRAHNGVVFAELRQGITATHRLSSAAKLRVTITLEDGTTKELGCQLQNVPAHFKRLFTCKRKDHLAAEVDQSQAEFRGAGFLSQCPQCLADIADPLFDAHIQSGQIIRDGERNIQAYRELFAQYKADPKAVKALRTNAKPHTFKPLFGGSSGTDAERAYYKWFGQHYHGITAAQTAWDEEVQQTGKYRAPTGMVFQWPVGWREGWRGGLQMINADTGRSLYSIVRNLPIQYFATGELAMVSFLCLVYECRRLGLRYYPVMLVHDSAEGEVHKDDADAWHEACGVSYGLLTWQFLHGVYGIDYNVELAAESSTGTHFGEGTDRAHKFLRQEIDSMKFSEGGEKKPRTMVPAGTHLAILNQVVDMGVQPGSGTYKPARKVFLRFEVPEERITYRRDDKELEGPLVIGAKFTASMNEKATLRKFVEGMVGRKFKAGEASQFDLTGLLGKAFLITVAHKTEGEATYANVTGAAPLMKGMKAGKAERPLLVYDMDKPDPGVLEQLAPWLQKAIKDSLKPGEPGDVPVNEGPGAPDLGQE